MAWWQHNCWRIERELGPEIPPTSLFLFQLCGPPLETCPLSQAPLSINVHTGLAIQMATSCLCPSYCRFHMTVSPCSSENQQQVGNLFLLLTDRDCCCTVYHNVAVSVEMLSPKIIFSKCYGTYLFHISEAKMKSKNDHFDKNHIVVEG